MTSSISDQNAAVCVKNIWNSLTNDKKIEKGQLVFEGGEKAIIQEVVTQAKKTLEKALVIKENATEQEVLTKLGELFTQTLSCKTEDKSAQTAVAGLAELLKTATTLTCEDPSAKIARTIAKAAYTTLFQGTFRGRVNKLKDHIAEKLLQKKILPKEYREALENTQKKAEETSSPIAIRNVVLQLKQAANKVSEKPSVFTRFLESFLNFLELFINVEKAVQIDLKIKEIVNKKQKNEPIEQKEVQNLSATSVSFNKKRLISHGVFTQIQIEQAKLLFATGEKEKAIQILQSIQGDFAAQYRHQIQDLREDSTQFNEVCSELQEETQRIYKPFPYLKALEMLNKPRSKESKRLNFTGKERDFIAEFLVFARANKELNEYLVNKEPKTEVEESLCAYTWVTLREKQDCTQEATKVENILEETGLQTFRDICHKTEIDRDGEPKLARDCLDALFCESPNPDKYIGDFVSAYNEATKGKTKRKEGEKEDPNFTELEELYSQMKFTPEIPKAKQQFSKNHLEIVTRVHNKLEKMKDSSFYIQSVRTKLNRAYEMIVEYKEKLEKGINLKAQLEKAAKTAPQKISLKELHLLEQFALFNGLFEILPKGMKQDERLELSESSQQAATVLGDLDYLLQLLPSYEPGDIILDDEIMKKGFQGKKESQVYSLQGGCLPPTNLISDLATKGPFAVQPYFTGSRTHAAIAGVFPDKQGVATLRRQEILTDFEDEPVSLVETVTSVSYRPNFEKFLTEEGRTAVEALKKKDKDFSLSALYQKHLNSYMTRNREKFKTYQNDCFKAANAFIEKLPWFPRKIIGLLQNRLMPQAPLTPEETKNLAKTTKVFCSEFVAIIINDIRNEVEKELQEILKAKKIKAEGPLFKKQISEKPELIDPGSLEKSISPYYDRQEPSLVTKLLLGHDFGPEKVASQLKNSNSR